MNIVETENDAALAEVYADEMADGGRQAEFIQIDGRPVLGNLSFDNEAIQLIAGGWNEDIKAVLNTLKSQFPDGQYPKEYSSKAEVVVNGKVRSYQVQQLNGDKDNRAQLFIGLGAFTNRGK